MRVPEFRSKIMLLIRYHSLAARSRANEINFFVQTSNTHKYVENSWKTRFEHAKWHKAFRMSSTVRYSALLSVKSTKNGRWTWKNCHTESAPFFWANNEVSRSTYSRLYTALSDFSAISVYSGVLRVLTRPEF